MIQSNSGKGGLIIWPLFGATNQMLAGLSLVLISFFLYKNKKKTLSYSIPATVIIIFTSFGLYRNITLFYEKENYFLTILAITLFMAQLWVILEIFLQLKKSKE